MLRRHTEDRADSLGVPGASPETTPHLILDQLIFPAVVVNQTQQTPATYSGRYYVVTGDGAQHPLTFTSNGIRSLDQTGYLLNTPNPTNFGPNYHTGNNGLPEMTKITGTVTDRRGNVYSGTSITDVNGNAITFSGNNLTDSAGRTVPYILSNYRSATTGCPAIDTTGLQPLTGSYSWVVPGPNGPVTYLFCYATIKTHTDFLGGYSLPATSYLHEWAASLTVLQSVVMPADSGQASRYWGFLYDAADPTNKRYGTGNLTTLIYPTGGRITYAYAQATPVCDSYRVPATPGVTLTTIPWGVSSRTTNDNNGTVSTWTYPSPSGAWSRRFTCLLCLLPTGFRTTLTV